MSSSAYVDPAAAANGLSCLDLNNAKLYHNNQLNLNPSDYSSYSHSNDSSSGILYQLVIMEMLPMWLRAISEDVEMLPWVGAAIGSILVGLSGVLPLLVIPIDETMNLKHGESANFLKTLLSFAVGGLLGDVFLHSLPEIWANDIANNAKEGHHFSRSGSLILLGLVIFVITEKVISVIQALSEQAEAAAAKKKNNNHDKYGSDDHKKNISGYLNLFANLIDNFTHGLSLGGAFLVSFSSGCLTTCAILVHEIPHEVGDFAILLKSGFSRWDAARMQLVTAGGGLVGAMVALGCSGTTNSMEARTSWILPFTAGTFLHIALVTVLPDLLKEKDPKESLKQLTALICGIGVMAFVSQVF